MKKTITTLLAIALSFAGVSCSIQEDAIVQQENANQLDADSEKFASAFAGVFEDIKIDFVTLFKYQNENELVTESERIYTLALEDMKDELAMHQGAAYMAFTVNVNNGIGRAGGAYFLNSQKNIALEQIIPNSRNEYETTRNVPVTLLNNNNGYKLVQENIHADDAKRLSAYLVDKVAKAKETGTFMLVSSTESISLYVKS